MIRPADFSDLPEILRIYRQARQFMRETGNAHQWGDRYPSQELLETDIRKQQLFLCVQGSRAYGAFVFFIGEEPTYAEMEQGAWASDTPCGVIHRVASDGSLHGVFAECLAFCRAQIGHLRIDTHEQNLVMQHQLAKHGFACRGVIRVEDGTPRLAYESVETGR